MLIPIETLAIFIPTALALNMTSKKQQHWLKRNGSALHRYGAGS